MSNLLTILRDTPTPSILVVAGIAFIFLAVSGGVSGKITVPPGRQRMAGVTGGLLLVAGLLLHLEPQPEDTSGGTGTGTNGGTNHNGPAPMDIAVGPHCREVPRRHETRPQLSLGDTIRWDSDAPARAKQAVRCFIDEPLDDRSRGTLKIRWAEVSWKPPPTETSERIVAAVRVFAGSVNPTHWPRSSECRAESPDRSAPPLGTIALAVRGGGPTQVSAPSTGFDIPIGTPSLTVVITFCDDWGRPQFSGRSVHARLSGIELHISR